MTARGEVVDMPWWAVLMIVFALFFAWAAYQRRNNSGDARGRHADDGRLGDRSSYWG